MPRAFAFPNTFEALPVEVICQVLENLEMHDLLACTTVRQRRLSSHTAYIQSEWIGFKASSKGRETLITIAIHR